MLNTTALRTLKAGLPLAMLCAIGSYFVFHAAAGFSAADVARVGWDGCALVLSLSLLNYLLRFLRWHFYLGALERQPPVLPDLVCYLAGFALTLSPGKAGEALRCHYLRRYGVSVRSSMAVLVTERLIDLVTAAILASVLLAGLPQARLPILVSFAACMAALWVLRIQNLAVPALVNRMGGKLLRVATDLLAAARALLRPAYMIPGAAVGLLAWIAEGSGFVLLSHRFGIDIAWTYGVGVYALALIAGAVSMLPGGLVSTEAAMIAFLTFKGAPLDASVAVTALCRLATLWFAVVLGMICALGLELRQALRPIPA